MPKRRIHPHAGTFVTFHFEDRVYQIDPEQKKVYKRFVEIETAKAATIFSNWRAQHLGA